VPVDYTSMAVDAADDCTGRRTRIASGLSTTRQVTGRFCASERHGDFSTTIVDEEGSTPEAMSPSLAGNPFFFSGI
jgi:hypothetical protein